MLINEYPTYFEVARYNIDTKIGCFEIIIEKQRCSPLLKSKICQKSIIYEDNEYFFDGLDIFFTKQINPMGITCLKDQVERPNYESKRFEKIILFWQIYDFFKCKSLYSIKERLEGGLNLYIENNLKILK